MDDALIARKYINKKNNAAQLGHEFSISLLTFYNLMRSKRCAYTGLDLTPESVTVDRIDNRLGYIKGNVCAVHEDANRIKAFIENPANGLTFENMRKMMKQCQRRGL